MRLNNEYNPRFLENKLEEKLIRLVNEYYVKLDETVKGLQNTIISQVGEEALSNLSKTEARTRRSQVTVIFYKHQPMIVTVITNKGATIEERYTNADFSTL